MVKRFSGPRKQIGHRTKSENELLFTHHAFQRMSERTISRHDIDFIIDKGMVRQGKNQHIVYYLPASPFTRLLGKNAERLMGCEVIISRDGELITVLRKVG